MTLRTRSVHSRAPVDHTGGHSPSQVSNRLRPVGHVASGSRPRALHRWSRAPARAKFPRSPSAISGERREKRPLTRRCRLFAVRHRLRQSLPASGFPPFMVELFTVGSFARTPAPSRAGPCRRRQRAPHAGQVERTLRDFHPIVPQSGCGPNPPGGIFTLLDDCGLDSCRGQSLSPLVRRTKTVSDRTPGLLRPHLLPYEGSVGGRDYADEPPSNRTSHSHGIRLYGSAPLRVVNSAPLVEVVSFDLPGGAAHLDDVSNAPRL